MIHAQDVDNDPKYFSLALSKIAIEYRDQYRTNHVALHLLQTGHITIENAIVSSTECVDWFKMT